VAVQAEPRLEVRAFAAILDDAGVAVTIRDTRGREIDAACGQLSLEHERAAAR
jgi:Predicted Fe-S-cluster redox enzyme